MSTSNSDSLVAKWANMTEDYKRRYPSRSKNNIFYEGNAIYSYGTHHKLAEFFDDEDGNRRYIINGDRASSSTSKHLGKVLRNTPWNKRVIISFRLLRQALDLPLDRWSRGTTVPSDMLAKIQALDVERESTTEVYKEKDGAWKLMPYENSDRVIGMITWSWDMNIPFENMMEGMQSLLHFRDLTPELIKELSPEKIGLSHHAGGVYFKYEDRYFVEITDERQLCMIEIPNGQDDWTVEQAVQSIVPDECVGKEYKRQGEWFFLPYPDCPYSIRHMRKHFMRLDCLPKKFQNSNPHAGKDIYKADDGSIYARGIIKHPQHKSIKLRSTWHKVFLNKEINSVTANAGRFD